MTPRKPDNQDAISQTQAAAILGLTVHQVARLVRKGISERIPNQHPSLSRHQVEEHLASPKPAEWVTTTEAAEILGISKSRTGQIAGKGLLPFEVGPNGRRRFRRQQVEVISRARQVRWHSDGPPINP